ncbi:ArsB/NhaD family transporter [Rhodovastum atsumiense]|uniref:ArsB/NhaD family transporter n=1 Tax=Rhodovastum atsumiense TaxID=504468 RepID=A0A5M6J146_9PROT|nr:ArsB/NhaD family transporter [Rhodovastum atsumiense]KAA5614310.1 ArsB/NhaD family transporter [Rhodovastum atsumiense]CAH2604771.1 ArsB/NhaD family transporter [Rhodovastum atsumiense]
MFAALPPVLIAVPVLVVTYALIIADRFDRSVIALLGGGTMILLGVLTQDEAIAGIDFNTIGLLTGMMLLVAISRRSGVFEYLAIRAAQLVRGSPSGLLVSLTLVTALLSSLLDNVTTVLLVAPVTIAIARRLGVAPFVFLVAEVTASNLGGTATLVGDPPNILIGSAADLSFNDFLLHMAPAALLALLTQVLVLHVLQGRTMAAGAAARTAVMAMRAREAIVDARGLRHAGTVFGLVLLGFCTARATGLEPGAIALTGGAALLLLDNLGHRRDAQFSRIMATYGEIDWITIFFFVGLFIVVRGVEVTGALAWIAGQITAATAGNPLLTASVVLWSAAILSAVIDNIPFVAAMIPVLQAMAPGLGGDAALLPLWVALSLGACFGGNGTLVGASANLTVAGIAQREGIPFGFGRYTRAALPLTLLSVVIAQAYLWLRYF